MSEQKVSIPFVSQKAEDLLLWRDQRKTGIVLVSISVFCIYVLMWRTPLLSLLCYSLSTVAVGSFLWAKFGQVLGIGAPAIPDKLKDGLSEDAWKSYVSTAKPHVNAAIASVYRVLSGKEINITVAVMMISFIAGKIFAVVNVLLVSYIAVLCAFSLPKLYEMNKEKIDHEVVPKIQETWKAMYAKLDEAVLQKIPRAGVTAVKKED